MKLLAIVAHPDDADIFCGGTLAKHADRGDSVTIAHMTKGEYGGFETTEADIAATREAEARRSGEHLGASDVTFLGFPDGRIEYSLENRLSIVETIRAADPDLILTHYRDDMHPDHRITARLVTDAYYMASLPLVESDFEPCDPDNVYFFGKPTSSFEPTVHIDISGYEDRKAAAIGEHESQVAFLEEHGGIDAEFDNLIDGVAAEDATRGKRTGVASAEGYVPLHDRADAFLG
ncbi:MULTISPECIES: PIG-L deacetylase family protein [Natrialba]|uniref:Putative LmbE-like protein n=2 Tax=Natrialba TaxID=63742 RepID=M0AK20_9EURY|nr:MULTISPECIES: PIG-L family deacetylase [Natrialba]ELY92347.1 putative LmbE-like protein [Natrialba taiwanensis DSM 12281]ELY97748.1 putative LmbE-like protein [Natrialba aegyptia DSM 13077]